MSAVRHVDQRGSLPITTDYDYLFKVLLIGDSAVGKSSIVNRYVEDFHDPRFLSTIGVDFKIRTFERHGKTIKLQIWDTAGQERFRSITTSYYRGADGIIMVHDLSRKESLDNVKSVWLREVKNYTGKKDPKLLLVGNKSDLKDRLTEEEQCEYVAAAESIVNMMGDGVQSVETSAKKGKNIDFAFETLVDQMVEAHRESFNRKERKKEKNPARGIRLLESQVMSSGSWLCCGLM